MSHNVSLADLANRTAEYGNTPYLVYTGRTGTARINHVVATVVSKGDTATVTCTGFGRGVAERVEAGIELSILWPAVGPGSFSLIVDGIGEITGDTLAIRASAAVLHRPAPVDGATGC